MQNIEKLSSTRKAAAINKVSSVKLYLYQTKLHQFTCSRTSLNQKFTWQFIPDMEGRVM